MSSEVVEVEVGDIAEQWEQSRVFSCLATLLSYKASVLIDFLDCIRLGKFYF